MSNISCRQWYFRLFSMKPVDVVTKAVFGGGAPTITTILLNTVDTAKGISVDFSLDSSFYHFPFSSYSQNTHRFHTIISRNLPSSNLKLADPNNPVWYLMQPRASRESSPNLHQINSSQFLNNQMTFSDF